MMQRFLKLEQEKEVVQISSHVVLALGCLLVGFGAGKLSTPAERQFVTLEQKVNPRTGFARAACLGTVLDDGKWGVVYDGC